MWFTSNTKTTYPTLEMDKMENQKLQNLAVLLKQPMAQYTSPFRLNVLVADCGHGGYKYLIYHGEAKGCTPQAMREIIVLKYLLSRNKQDLMSGLLNPFFSTSNLDLVAGVIWAGDLDFGCSFEFQILQLLAILSNDKTVVLLGDGNCC